MRRFEEALACYDKALAINPYHSDTWYNRGNNLQEMGLYREALASYEKTLTMTPENQKAHFNDGACRLLLGDFKEGWKQYEWRWKAPDNIAQLQKHIKPRWVGESLLGKRIYLDVEQGLGDMIQFVRFVKTIADLGAYVLLPCVDSLADLFRNVEGVGKIILNGQAYPELDYHCPLMSVPFVLGIELATLPNKVPYLYSDEKKCEEWLNRLGKKTKLRVGLVWSGNPEFGNDHNRSIPLEKLSYLNSDKIEWHSLHKECRESDESILKQRGDIHFWGEHIESFSDTAALIDLMDLVISVDTAVAHLAGAMNKPVWILLPFSPDWRWLIGRDDSPWYQSAKLFRQTEYGNWDEVIQRVDAALKLDWVK
jgi:tetratricopeptide (TPR) repeat protein